MYQASNDGMLVRLADGASIPHDPENRDYVEYLQWLSEGNEPEPADLPPAPPLQTKFSSVEFLELFPEEEQLAVVSAAMVDAQVKLFYDKMLGADYVDLEDPRTIAGIQALQAAGLIGTSEAGLPEVIRAAIPNEH